MPLCTTNSLFPMCGLRRQAFNIPNALPRLPSSRWFAPQCPTSTLSSSTPLPMTPLMSSTSPTHCSAQNLKQPNLRSYCNFKSARVDTFLFMVGQITGKMFDHLIEKDCDSDLSGPATCRTGPIRQLPGSDRSETQSFSIGWSNILPVI